MIARAAASLRLRAADAADTIRGRRDPLIPPRRLAGLVGDSDFRATGEEFLGHFQTLGGLRSDDRVLDIGCGFGRMARVLAGVLRPPGSYDGFDVMRPGIEWCHAHYVDTPVRFAFTHVDLHNAAYNPHGTGSAVDFAFPYADGSFTFALATSLFTHLLPDAGDHYLAQAARVLAPGGRLFTTWMLMSGEPPAPLRRLPDGQPAAVADPDVPEDAVAVDESWVRDRLGAHGLTLTAIHPGSWAGGSGASQQDIVVATRAGR